MIGKFFYGYLSSLAAVTNVVGSAIRPIFNPYEDEYPRIVYKENKANFQNMLNAGSQPSFVISECTISLYHNVATGYATLKQLAQDIIGIDGSKMNGIRGLQNGIFINGLFVNDLVENDFAPIDGTDIFVLQFDINLTVNYNIPTS